MVTTPNRTDGIKKLLPTLTKLEREILDHRLEVTDAIADFLEDSGEGDDNAISAGFEDLDAGNLTPMARLILRDCVEGSTYYGAAGGAEGHQTSPQHAAIILRAGRSLAVKVGALIGEELTYPNY